MGLFLILLHKAVFVFVFWSLSDAMCLVWNKGYGCGYEWSRVGENLGSSQALL